MNGSGPLYDELHRRFEAAVEPQPVHRFLASLCRRSCGSAVRPHQLIVSGRYDLALERAFEEAGEEVDVVTYVAAGPYRGKFWHSASGRGAAADRRAEHVRDRAVARPPDDPAQAPRRRRPVPGARVGELRHHRGRLHRLPRQLRRRGRGPGRARGAAAAQPLPLPRLRDGRLEPAVSSCTASGATGRSPTGRGPSTRSRRRSSAPSGAASTSTCSLSTRTSTSGASQGASRPWRERRVAVQGSRRVRGLGARRAVLLRARARYRDRRREPHRVAPHRALRAERRRQVVAAPRGRRQAAARASRGAARGRLRELGR